MLELDDALEARIDREWLVTEQLVSEHLGSHTSRLDRRHAVTLVVFELAFVRASGACSENPKP